MPLEEWRAWEQTLASLMQLRYLTGYWRVTRGGFNESFARFLDAHLAARPEAFGASAG
jgi:hypothetical protein